MLHPKRQLGVTRQTLVAGCWTLVLVLVAGAGAGARRSGLYFTRGQLGSRSAFRFGGTHLRKVRAPWARRQVTPGHGGKTS